MWNLGAWLFEQPPKPGEQGSTEAQRSDHVIFPSGLGVILFGERIEAGRERVDRTKLTRLQCSHTGQAWARDEQHSKSGDSRRRSFFVGGEELIEQTFAFDSFIPCRWQDIGMGGFRLGIVAGRQRQKHPAAK